MSDLREKLTEEFLEDEEYAYGYYNDFLNLYIATQIKVLREQRGYKTQTAFAREKGIKQEQLSRWENIDTNAWSVNTLRRIARAFGVVVKVSFEEFSGAIDTIVNFRRETLQRLERVADLSRYNPIESTEQRVTLENRALRDVKDRAELTNTAAVGIVDAQVLKQGPTPFKRETLYGTYLDKPGPSHLAVSLSGSKSAGQSSGGQRAA